MGSTSCRWVYLLIYLPTQVQLTLTKIIKIVATRWRILRLKYTEFDFGWGFAPDPAGELTTLPQTSLLDLGAASRKGEGLGWGRGGKDGGEGEEGGSGGGGKGRAPKLLLNHDPSETCYATESLLKY